MTNENFYLILCGIAGVVFHCLLKLNNLRKDALVANVSFQWKRDYLRKDGISIIMAFLSVGIWYLVFGEVANKYPALVGFRRVSFIAMGAIGSYVIQLLLGKAQAQIRKVVDVKTDAADGKQGPDILPKANQ